MSLTWTRLREMLKKEISTPGAEQTFRAAQPRTALLGSFANPQSAVDWLLARRCHSVEDEDAVLRELRTCCLADDGALWMAVLFLGLWPVFEWVLGKVSKFADEDQAGISAIWEGVLQALEREDLWSRPGVAKRVMYFVRKRARGDLRADAREEKKLQRVAAYEEAGTPKDGGKLRVTESTEAWPAFSNRSPRKDDSDEGEVRQLRRLLVEQLGLPASDAELLIRHFVKGETLLDIASDYGISHVACRQRCSRITRRLHSRSDEVRTALVTHLRESGMGNREGSLPLTEPDGGEGCAGPWTN